MEIYNKKHRPPLKVRKVWTLDGRSLERISGDGGGPVGVLRPLHGAPQHQPLEDGQPVLACMMESGASPSPPGVFLKAGESAVFTDLDRDQIRFPSSPPMYRGTPGTPVIVPLAVKEAEK